MNEQEVLVVERPQTPEPGDQVRQEEVGATRDDLVFQRGRRPPPEPAAAPHPTTPPPGFAVGLTFQDAKTEFMEWFGRHYLRNVLQRHGGNITRSAAEAGVTRFYMRQLMRRFGIDGDE